VAGERAPVRAFVGLGSNLGDRRANLTASVRLLGSAPNVQILAVSALYETPPWGFLSQAPFLNAVAALETTLGPRQLLVALKSFESRIGRRPTFHWGPRLIDLDLLAYDDLTISRRGLTVPHPSTPDRAFVLLPLADVCADYRAPDGRTLPEILGSLDLGGIRRIEETGWPQTAP
jgi:2-amino-4-hydroxy-6-hydroxymethyldihydropteridine diphosphokinase